MAGRIKIRDINQDPGVRPDASGGNDPLPTFNGGAHGSIAYRGTTKWEILGPGTAGNALTTNGVGANPSWSPADTTVKFAPGNNTIIVIIPNPTFTLEVV